MKYSLMEGKTHFMESDLLEVKSMTYLACAIGLCDMYVEYISICQGITLLPCRIFRTVGGIYARYSSTKEFEIWVTRNATRSFVIIKLYIILPSNFQELYYIYP